jgi:outer membrane protein assembly factor BamD
MRRAMSLRRRAPHLLLAAGLALAAAGCAEFNFTGAGRATLTYTDDARAAYFEAMESFKARSWEDARVLFGEVKKLFAYTRYARLADLRLADIDFEQARYSDAVAGYRDFVQNHRNDRDVEYARYRISKSLFKDIEDSFILPPAEERDQGTTMEAFRDLKNFLSDFPQSRYYPDARYMYEVVLQRLVRHELYLARFYLHIDDFEATIARIDYALTKYPSSGLDAEALVLKGETLLKMKRDADARVVFEKVIAGYASPFAEVAKKYLADLGPAKDDDVRAPVPPAAPSGGGGAKDAR